MMDAEENAVIEVELSRDDIMHLLKHGTAVEQKRVGPIRVHIRCNTELRTAVVLDDPEEGCTEVSE